MMFGWLKHYVPRGLYGRAALILLLPIITLQILVSVVFIQRHFEDVTRQMTRKLVLELRLLQQEIDAAETLGQAKVMLERLTEPLRLNAELPNETTDLNDQRRFYDLSGRIVMLTLKADIPAITRVNLADNSGRVTLWMDTDYGPLKIWFSRSQVSASNPHQFLVLMMFVGIVMTLVAFVFLRNQLRPIKRLARAAEAFGHGRIEEYRPTGAIEVRSAGNAFLDMRARIERHIEQRTMMLSGVSHDLRTPLTRFKLGLSMLEKDTDTEGLKRDIKEMERLLNAFLAFARDDAWDDPVETDPILLVQEIVAKYAKNGANIRVSNAQGQGTAMLRPLAIERVLDNLIGNGLRYSRAVEVGVVLTDKSIKFTVQDKGPGISEKLHAEAMKPFVRLDSARNQDGGSGVGLGLSIAHDIARRHGGTLRLGKSQKMGGLQVDVVLPR